MADLTIGISFVTGDYNLVALVQITSRVVLVIRSFILMTDCYQISLILFV